MIEEVAQDSIVLIADWIQAGIEAYWATKEHQIVVLANPRKN